MTLAELNKVHEIEKAIPQLHSLFCKLVHCNYPLSRFGKNWCHWERWTVAADEYKRATGMSHEDQLLFVVSHLQTLKEAKRAYPESLTFRNLIEDVDKFKNRLAEAETEERRTAAKKREPKIDHERRFVLEATGRSAEPERPQAMSAEQVMEQHKKMAEMLRKFRIENLTTNENTQRDPT